MPSSGRGYTLRDAKGEHGIADTDEGIVDKRVGWTQESEDAAEDEEIARIIATGGAERVFRGGILAVMLIVLLGGLACVFFIEGMEISLYETLQSKQTGDDVVGMEVANAVMDMRERSLGSLANFDGVEAQGDDNESEEDGGRKRDKEKEKEKERLSERKPPKGAPSQGPGTQRRELVADESRKVALRTAKESKPGPEAREGKAPADKPRGLPVKAEKGDDKQAKVKAFAAPYKVVQPPLAVAKDKSAALAAKGKELPVKSKGGLVKEGPVDKDGSGGNNAAASKKASGGGKGDASPTPNKGVSSSATSSSKSSAAASSKSSASAPSKSSPSPAPARKVEPGTFAAARDECPFVHSRALPSIGMRNKPGVLKLLEVLRSGEDPCIIAFKECVRAEGEGDKVGSGGKGGNNGASLTREERAAATARETLADARKHHISAAEYETYAKLIPHMGAGGLGSCAFVANGDNLKRHPRGAEIDAHDTVIRFNTPLSGFEKSVGKKASILYMKSKYGVPRHVPEVGWLSSGTMTSVPVGKGKMGGQWLDRVRGKPADKKSETARWTISGKPVIFRAGRGPPGHPKLLPQLLQTASGGKKVPTNGFKVTSFLLISGLCRRLDLYGFTAGGSKYFNRGANDSKAHWRKEQHIRPTRY
eukprot:jgi/Mesvir1/21679/Mv04100-RA.1